MTAPGLWVCGARGVGKSTVGFAIFVRTMQTGVKTGYVDLDQIGFVRPPLPEDPHGHRLRARTLAGMWEVFRAAGARCLVISGGVGDRSALEYYRAAVPGVAITVCRLHGDPSALQERLLMRGRGLGPPIPGDELRGQPPEALSALAAASADEAEALELDGIGDLRVDTDGRSADLVAEQVMSLIGDWPETP